MPGDGSDYVLSDWGGYQDINDIKNNFASASAPSSPEEGCLWYDTGNSQLKQYSGSAWEVVGSATGNLLPVGSIIQYMPGYYGDASNGSYTNVLPSANTAAAVNTLLNAAGWYVCNGAALNLSGSPIFDGSGRYLPNLTDDRFVMGDTSVGTTGGNNAMAHTHDFDVAAKNTGTEDNTDTLTWGVAQDVAQFSHTHSCDPPSTTSDGESQSYNRPKFLGGFYIIRAI